MTVRQLRSFRRDLRAAIRAAETRSGPDYADRLAEAAADAVGGLVATHPGFDNSYALSRESDDLPGGPYREKLFGLGKSRTHRVVFRVTPAAVELVAVRHLAQDDLTPLDL